MTAIPLPLTATSASSAPVGSFEEFFRSQYPSVVRAVAIVADDLGDAEELVQEAMVRAYVRWPRVAQFASPSGYVYRIAVNLHRSRLRRRRVLRRWMPVGQVVDDETAAQAIARTDLVRALKRLPPNQLDALLLVEWFGLTSDAAAPLLGIAPGSVRSRITRARAILKVALGAELAGGGDD